MKVCTTNKFVANMKYALFWLSNNDNVNPRSNECQLQTHKGCSLFSRTVSHPSIPQLCEFMYCIILFVVIQIDAYSIRSSQVPVAIYTQEGAVDISYFYPVMNERNFSHYKGI